MVLPESIRKIACAVRCVEADGISEAKRGGTGGSVFRGRQINTLDHVETASIEEHIDHQPASIRAIDSSGVPEPCANALRRLAERFRNVSAAAIDADKAAVDRRPAWLDPGGGHGGHIAELRHQRFRFSEQNGAFLFAIQKVDYRREIGRASCRERV